MNAPDPRGRHLVRGGMALPGATGWAARLVAGSFERLLRRIDAGMATGSLEAQLPDGSVRLLGGRAPGFDARVHVADWRALLRLATGGSVGWYQGWERGEWDSPDLAAIFALFMANAAHLGGAARAKGPWRWMVRFAHLLNRNSKRGAQRNIAAHYDLGNDFYAAWLGRSMAYSSAKFRTPGETLEEGQHRKMADIADRLAIAGGDTVLEIGCGWGTQAQVLAGRGGGVTAISLSQEQLAHADRCHAGKADFMLRDYRDVTGQFDAIASVEMVEALGREYWPSFLACIDRLLKPGGRAAIQFISMRDELFDAYAGSADFIQTYIFPGGMLIRTNEFRALAERRGLEWRDQEDFGKDYAETLRIWRDNFDAAVDEGRLPAGFDNRFVRLWRYYLMYCEGGFRGGGIDVHQVTLVKPAG